MAPQTTSKRGEFSFTVPIADVRMDAAGDPEAKGAWTFRGHAAVFNRKSHDLGGFRTVIASSFFNDILDTNPDVHLVWDHDMRWVLGRTRNNSLELRVDPYGLHTWARFPKTATAEECAILLRDGFIDQMSFACDIGEDEWTQDTDGNITRTLYTCSGLYDTTICAQGAFPQTDAQLAASYTRSAGDVLASAVEAGRIKIDLADPDLVASRGESEDSIAQPAEAEGATAVADDRNARLAALQASAEERYAQHTKHQV